MDELREYIESIKSDYMFVEDNKIYLSPAMFNLSINEIINVIEELKYEYEVEESATTGKYVIVYLQKRGTIY
mgnify:FL=1